MTVEEGGVDGSNLPSLLFIRIATTINEVSAIIKFLAAQVKETSSGVYGRRKSSVLICKRRAKRTSSGGASSGGRAASESGKQWRDKQRAKRASSLRIVLGKKEKTLKGKGGNRAQTCG